MFSRLLITGGSGFIGSNFIRHVFAARPQTHITNLDALTYSGNAENLRDIEGNPRYTFVHADICDAEAIRPLVAKADAVVHFAAESHVDRSILDTRPFIRTNVLGTQTLLDAAVAGKLKTLVRMNGLVSRIDRSTCWARRPSSTPPSPAN